MYVKIVKGKLQFPDQDPPLSEEYKDFVERLLTKDPTKRLGAAGFEEVISHPFLKDIDYDSLRKMELPAPYLPQLTTDVFDVSNFEEELTNRTSYEDARVSYMKAEMIKDVYLV